MRTTSQAATILAATALLIAFQGASARIHEVPDDYEAIQDAIDASRPGDTVLVHPGDYERTELTISHDLTLAGEYLLTGDERTIEQTVLYGDEGRATILVSTRQINLWLVGLRLTDSFYGIQANSNRRYPEDAPCLYVFNCQFDNNVFAIWAGEIPRIVVVNSSFRENSSVYVNSLTSMRIQDCNFEGNGSLYFSGERSSISHCRFIDNRSGIRFSGGTISDCYFEGNSAPQGGAMRIQSGSAENCTFIDNHATSLEGDAGEGGAIYVALWDDVSVTNCTFLGNISDNQGGAIYAWGWRQGSITNCTFFGNTSRAGGGGDIYFEGGEPDWGEGGSLILSNSILLQGDPQAVTFHFNQWSEFMVSYCDIQGGRDQIAGDIGEGQFTWGEGNFDSDPLFVDPDNGDFHLTADSPCIDTGDPDSPLDPDGTRADMGAYYFDRRGDPPQIIDYMPAELNLTEDQGDTVQFVVRAEDAEGDSVRFLWRYNGEIISEDTIVTIAFQDAGEVIVQCSVSDGLGADSVYWNVTVQDLAVPSDNLQFTIFNLQSAYPNPFNSSTTIRFSLSAQSAKSAVRLAVYDLQGRIVSEL